jgi:hypothetical protein
LARKDNRFEERGFSVARNGDAMFDQLIDGVRKASESSLQMQQEMFKQWTRLFAGTPMEAGAQGEWGRTSQKRWVDLGVEILNRHRETLDATYKAGIQIIEQTFHVGEAKNPDDYRRMVEDLWRKLFDLQKSQSESQFRDFQTFYEKSAALVQDVRA